MKKILIVLFAIICIVSCEKDDSNNKPVPVNSIAEDLKLKIQEEGIETIKCCFEKYFCDHTYAGTKDYSFPGNNFIRVGTINYNLNHLIKYETRTIGPKPEKRMTLYFP
jgi:hypothetical protein